MASLRPYTILHKDGIETPYDISEYAKANGITNFYGPSGVTIMTMDYTVLLLTEGIAFYEGEPADVTKRQCDLVTLYEFFGHIRRVGRPTIRSNYCTHQEIVDWGTGSGHCKECEVRLRMDSNFNWEVG